MYVGYHVSNCDLHQEMTGSQTAKGKSNLGDDLEFCSECEQRSVRFNQSEGSMVCLQCGLVTMDRMIKNENEFRNFENSDQTQNRLASAMTPDQINKMSTELTWRSKQKHRYDDNRTDKVLRSMPPSERKTIVLEARIAEEK